MLYTKRKFVSRISFLFETVPRLIDSFFLIEYHCMCRGEKITKKKVEKKRRRRNIVSLYTNERTKLALVGFVPLSLNKRDKIVHMGSCNMQITKREGRKKKVDEKKKREKGGEASHGAIFLFDRNSINCREDGSRGKWTGWLLQEIWLSSIGTISNYRSKK